MATEYVRVTPIDKARGAAAKRVVVGGKLFVAGKWYEMPSTSAAKLRSLKQSTGAPYFDVMSEEQFRETARRELAAAMTAAGLAGLAMQGAELPKAVPAPKEGPRESAFAGMEETAREVDTSRAVATKADAPAESAEPADSAPNFDRMTKAQLKDWAEEHGVELPSGASAAKIRGILRDSV